MTHAKFAAHVLVFLVILALLPSPATAQSSITGIVKDTSGAIMPNVTVEASSPALIEKSRTATTDGQGRYSIIDIRPGTYSVTFTMSGFKTQRREGVDVPANTSVPLYIEMGVGSVGETVEVQALAPVVDVENAANHQVLTREIQDAIPAPRNMQAFGGLTPGIQLHNAAGGNPDVGGSQQMEQTYILGHGSGANQTTVLLDGMNINSNYLDGTIQNYVDNGIIQQATYQTSGVTAEVSAGGALVNQVPKDGGNVFHGDVFASGTGQGGWWQANNLSQSLKDRFAAFGQKPSVNSIVHIKDINATLGGPILKDRLWFLGSYRYQSTYDSPAGVFNPDGSPGIEDQYIKQGVLRLSWQISSKDKFSGTFDRIQKFKGHELSGLATPPNDPNIAASRRGPPNYWVAQAKYTRIQSPNLLLEGGFSTDVIYFSIIYLPGQEEVPFSPAWFAHTSRVDSTLGFRSNAPPVQSYFLPARRNVSGSATYIWGSHTFKAGVQDAWGKNDRVASLNGDLYQNYSAGTPTSVTVFNTPIALRQHVVADLGIYAMDTWHIKRLSLTAGVRFEYQKSTIDPSAIPGGRFIGPRSFDRIDCDTIKGLGCWKTWSPRIGGVYDLFGNGKTAIKASFGKYYIPQETGYLTNFNPMALLTETRVWQDKDYATCVAPGSSAATCRALPSNGDGIAQDNEIAPTTNVNFGKATNIPKLDPNFKREYALQYSAGFTHQIRPGMAASFNWFRRTNYDQAVLINRAVDPVKDWTPFTVTNPLDGKTFTAYNLNADARTRPADLYQTNADHNLRRNTYTGYEMTLSGRLPHRGHLMAAWTIDRITDITCDMPIGSSLIGLLLIDGNNITNASLNDPNSLRYCDERGLIPFRHEAKVIGTMPLKWGLEASMVFQSSPEFLKYVNWDVTSATIYPGNCVGCTPNARVNSALTQTERLPLAQPGSRYADRLNQLDVGIRRTFVFKDRYRLQAQIDVFNATNSNTVLVETQTLGTAALSASNPGITPFIQGGPGGRPTSILQARLLRLALQFHF